MPSLFSLLSASALFCLSLGLPSSSPTTATTDSDSNIDVGTARSQIFRELITRAGIYDAFPPSGPAPNPDSPPLKVGILGAGASGLYSALLLHSLGIDYEILEADCRVGGRIYTHYFDPKAWQQSTPEDPAYYNYYVSRTESAAGGDTRGAN